MSIGERVQSAIDALQRAEPTNALIQLSIALDATAKREIKPAGRSPIIDFIEQNTGLITFFAFGSQIKKLNLACDLGKTSKSQVVPKEISKRIEALTMGTPFQTDLAEFDQPISSFGEVIYYAVRCPLLHEGRISEYLQFHEDSSIQGGSPLLLPQTLLIGFILAIVASPFNAEERCEDSAMVNSPLMGVRVPLNSLWGCRREIHWYMENSHKFVEMRHEDET